MCAALNTSRDRQFEEYLRDGIIAAKSGNKTLAQTLLTRALMVNKNDARPYLWLSATTDDPKEQREYLEQAVVLDPRNVAARRGLAMLTGKVDQSRLVQPGESVQARKSEGDIEAQVQSFKCPQCGGRMVFSVQNNQLVCEYCGYARAPEKEDSPHPVADRSEQVLEFVMPTTRAHLWAAEQHRLSCQHCGAVSLLPPGQKAVQCAYCGSNQLVDAVEHGELVDPQVILTMKVDEKEAIQHVKDWLGRGFFLPDDLRSSSKRLRLRPAYYSCWTFDGTLEIRWSCEVKEGSGRYERWVARNGVETQFFDDVLVSGVRALKQSELSSIEPFYLKDVEEFQPEYLAGWSTMIYDRSLSDASLLARERVIRKIRPQLYSVIEVGYEKRNVNIGAGSWSGMTFKHVLLPVWIGTYHFNDQEFHVLVNGQTGKVGGKKPRDVFKLVFALLIALGVISLLIVLYWLFLSPT
jgi:DNA-directed RNA polymerase subunit RPC12/RpoP